MPFAPDDGERAKPTPASAEHEAILRDIQIQLRGPGLSGWPQPGSDTGERHRTMVEALAATFRQIAELRTEAGDLEVAELERQVRETSPRRLPWPLSLAEGALLLMGEQVARLESLPPDRPAADSCRSGDERVPRKSAGTRPPG